ncbi:hypothetical protein ONZ43_g1580 [Nemania bipapillata]|uniref:Uncharacterized protein n=1 Tax=Nemania bipapillata TaxID=110536 RepID=A0ACC2J411_9PEZI|nr:hypothetical protein ONZ43_g1580 [Nemania bipapillata]
MLFVSIALLWQVMGLSAIPGLVVMALLLPINISLAKGFNYTQKKIMAATDKRIHTTNEILQNIRIIKYFAWEGRFGDIVDEKRRVELKALRNRYIVWALAVAIWNTVPILITFFSFLMYTKIERKPLYPSIAFTAISLFLLLRIPLDQLGDMLAHVQEAKVSVDRVEEFLMEDETEKYQQLGQDNVDEEGRKVIGFRDAAFIWGSKNAVAADGSLAFRLMDLNIDFKIGKLNIIGGPTGSGKTSMLMALLGEMTLTKGKVYLPGGRSREDVHPSPTGLADTCAYVAQTAWLGMRVPMEMLRQKKSTQKQDAMREDKATGAVKWPVMKLYLSAMGRWWFWAVAVVVFTTQQLSGVASNIWIKEWANQYVSGIEAVSRIQFGLVSQNAISVSISRSHFTSIAQYAKDTAVSMFGPSPDYSTMDVPEVNVDYYLIILALIGLAGAFLALVRDLWLFFGSLTASWKLHKQLMTAVSRAKFKFFDVTPLGQLMNRFSKDLEAVDQEVAGVAIGVMTCAMGIAITVVLIAAITPGFLVAAVFITALFVFVAMFYLRASRDLKRLESVNRSPLFQQFGETLSGVTTIRAYGDERRFIRDNLARINKQSRPFIFLWGANRWLSFRTDVLGDLVAFFAGVFVIISIGKIDPGSAGLSLSYAIGFSENILWLIRLYAMNEQNMNSVERVKEYLDVEQESAAINEQNRPPMNWPSHGSVEFIGYSTRYRKELEPVLKDVTFKIEPRQKVGIVGRTGAGKSSLTLAIFRALEAEAGKILIDDVDIGMIGLQDLRQAITIVPQDPTLFTGTIRSNLDPFDLYTDDEIFTGVTTS